MTLFLDTHCCLWPGGLPLSWLARSPFWLAKHNMLIFGAVYLAGVAFALAPWARAPS
jgi:hypothetical protein